MNINNAYYAFIGLAYSRGVDNAEVVMPISRFSSLLNGCLETKGFSWAESSFISWAVSVCGREQRNIRPIPADPKNSGIPPICKKACKYMQTFRKMDSQRNALRMEVVSMISERRCGWNLKPGRVGGDPLDYAPCTFSSSK